jgi:hypothetical protein
MSFFPPDQVVPAKLETNQFLLLPLKPVHGQIDYEAVMSSRDLLRLWSGSAWPRDDFTLAENMTDLQGHDHEHQERIAFTFTVLNPEQNRCLGCVYTRPLSELVKQNPKKLSGIREDEAITRFWVRASLLGSGFDLFLLQALIRWYRDSWPFSTVYFHTRSVNDQQVALLEKSKLPRQLTLDYPQRGGLHHFYRAVPAK